MIIGASAAVVSATVGVVVLVLSLLWRRPLLTVAFHIARPEHHQSSVYVLSIRNDGDRTVRDIQAQALLDGKPLSGVDLLGSWTLGPERATEGSFVIALDAVGPDPSRLSARVSYPRRRGRKHQDVRFGEWSVTLR